MPNITIYDVAAKATVSIATVSRVLNSPGRVNATTRQRVLVAIDELGFVPRADATARARQQSRRVGVLAPFFTYPSFVQRLRGVAEVLDQHNLELVIFDVHSDSRKNELLHSLPIGRSLDGLVIMSLAMTDEAINRILDHKLAAVLIENNHPDFSRVTVDNIGGGEKAANYLVGKGHSRLAFVGDRGVPDYVPHTSDQRLSGFRQGLQQRGLDLPPTAIRLADHGLEEARRCTHDLLDLPEPPTAIFAASDTQAMGVLKAAKERNVRVPNQLAVMGFDDLDIADYIGLTTISQSLEESGRVAAELLRQRMADPTRAVQHVTLPLTLQKRETA